MAKKKFADGGLTSLGNMTSTDASSNFSPMPSAGVPGGGGGARGGMQQINQALDQISGAIGGATYKKGGSVKGTKSKISTGESSGKKSGCW